MHIARITRGRTIRTGIALALFVGAAGCGDDASSSAAEPTGACAQLVQFDAVATDTEDLSSPEDAKALGAQLAPLWQQALAAVPESARADGEVITQALADLEEGDAEAFNADATLESYVGVLGAAVESCGFARRAVSATKDGDTYKFGGLPAKVDAGVVAITVTNKDAEPHVLVVARKSDGERRSAKELLGLPEEEASSALTPAGAAFAAPGSSSIGLARLTPGKYVYFCPIPAGGVEGAAPHFANGMYGELTVG